MHGHATERDDKEEQGEWQNSNSKKLHTKPTPEGKAGFSHEMN
jgi:hypothetical protein